MQDNQGLALTSGDAKAVAAYNDTIAALLDYRLSAMPTLKGALELDPDFCMAHCLRGYMLMMMNSSKVHGGAAKELAAAQSLAGAANERERMHVKALEYWIAGDQPKACAQWQALVARYPLDIMAIRLHHFASFWLGRSQQLISLPASAFPAWDETMPGFGNMLGMMSFGLEETGSYREAEAHGRRAVEISGDDMWAIHAVAHVLEMQSRFKDGLEWLDYPKDTWADRNPFRGHVWWHRGLYVIADGQLDAALQLYDESIYDTTSVFYLDLQNAVAFLKRLELAGKDVGSRWQALADHAMEMLDDHELVFTDMNNVIALGRAGRGNEARDYLDAMRTYANTKSTHAAAVMKRVGIPICESLLAYEEGRHGDALEALMLYKPVLIEVGASHAQRDLISLITIDAARRGGKTAELDYLNRERAFLAGLASAA